MNHFSITFLRRLTASLLGLSLLAASASAGLVLTTLFEEGPGSSTGSGSALANGLTYRVSGGAGTAWQAAGVGLAAQAGTNYLEITNTSVRNFSTLFNSPLTGSEESATLDLKLGFDTGTTFGTGLFKVILFADVNGDNFYSSGGSEDIASLDLGDFTAPTTAGTFETVVLSYSGIDTSTFVGKNLGFYISAKTTAAGESFAIDGLVELTTFETSVIPEPSSLLALITVVVFGLLGGRRRSGAR